MLKVHAESAQIYCMISYYPSCPNTFSGGCYPSCLSITIVLLMHLVTKAPLLPRNELTALPESLPDLQSLEKINASDNKLTRLPQRYVCNNNYD